MSAPASVPAVTFLALIALRKPFGSHGQVKIQLRPAFDPGSATDRSTFNGWPEVLLSAADAAALANIEELRITIEPNRPAIVEMLSNEETETQEEAAQGGGGVVLKPTTTSPLEGKEKKDDNKTKPPSLQPASPPPSADDLKPKAALSPEKKTDEKG